MNIANDKLLHHFVATFIAFVVINLTAYFGLEFYGFLFVVIGILAKELVWDKYLKRGTPEFMDFLFGLVPTILIYLTKIF